MAASPMGGRQGPKSLLDSMILAVRREDIAALRQMKPEFLIVDENFEKCVDESGDTLAHMAIHKDPATLKFVVEDLHAEINVANGHGKTPLHEAVAQNFTSCVRYLLMNGAEYVKCFSHTLSTPLHTAASCGSIESLDILYEHHKLSHEKKLIEQQNQATKKEAPTDVALLEFINEADRNKSTALHKCAFEGDVRVARWLLDRGAKVDSLDIHETTPFLVAVKMDRMACVDMLLERGADVLHMDSEGNNAMHHCAARSLLAMAKRLSMAKVVDESAKQQGPAPGASPVNPSGQQEEVKMKLAGKQLVCERNNESNSPLHIAAIDARPDSADWQSLVLELIRVGGQELMEYSNLSNKKAVDYAGRNSAYLFSMEEVTHRDNERKKAERAAEEKRREAHELKAQEIAELRKHHEQKQQRVKEEEERRLRELEDRVRAEEDAKLRREEIAEAKRIEEEEAKRKKAKKK